MQTLRDWGVRTKGNHEITEVLYVVLLGFWGLQYADILRGTEKKAVAMFYLSLL